MGRIASNMAALIPLGIPSQGMPYIFCGVPSPAAQHPRVTPATSQQFTCRHLSTRREAVCRVLATASSITVESMDGQSEGTNKHSSLPQAEVMPLPRHGHGSLLMAQPIGPGSLAQTVLLAGVGGAGMAANRQKPRQTNSPPQL